jgi:acyl-CoA synthetase (AMP-forming)/AMP-acid ligase II
LFTGGKMATLNIAQRIRDHAQDFPDRVALAYPDRYLKGSMAVFAHMSFREIDVESDSYARGFARLGITRGTKTILMVKPGKDLFTIIFALFKLGAIPVIVDPGMGIKRMLHCYRAAGAEAFIGIPIAQIIRLLNPSVFLKLKAVVTVGGRFSWGATLLGRMAGYSSVPFPIAATSPQDLCIVNFTTGSTGPAKGVEYTHGMAEAMVREVAVQFRQDLASVSLATLPLFAIFDLLIGSISVLAPMDPTKPAKVNPKKIIDAIHSFRVTHLFASPALLYRLAEYGYAKSIQLPTLKQVISGGAPVSSSIVEKFQKLLSKGAVFQTTYGATEALPISSITSDELLGPCKIPTQTGKGTCVGKSLSGCEVRIIQVSDAPIKSWSNSLLAKVDEVGEIILSGPIVSQRYHEDPVSNQLFKISGGGEPTLERIWHRTGDLGSLDSNGRIWFCGRKSQRVITAQGTLHTVQCEGVFNSHPDIYRSALVGVGEGKVQEPILCVELRSKPTAEKLRQIEKELRELALQNSCTQEIKVFLFNSSFPVDIRHNAKIGRELLARWARNVLAGNGSFLGVKKSRRWLMSAPVAGWLLIVIGLVFPFETEILKIIWWIDIFLSVGVHSLQLFLALPIGKLAGFRLGSTILYTLLFGATWWKSLDVNSARVRASRDAGGPT